MCDKTNCEIIIVNLLDQKESKIKLISNSTLKYGQLATSRGKSAIM